MKLLLIISISLIVQCSSFTQQKDELIDISRYLLIRDVAKFWEEDLLPLNYVTEHLELIKSFTDSSKFTKYNYNLTKIDSINGFNIYSILDPNQTIVDEYHFFAKTRTDFIEIYRDSVQYFINRYIYKNIENIHKEQIIELYDKITFYGMDVNFYKYNLSNDSTKPNTLNFLRKDNDAYTMSKAVDVKNDFYVDTYLITYIFRWNGLEVRKFLERRLSH